jgi:hypothetical protein
LFQLVDFCVPEIIYSVKKCFPQIPVCISYLGNKKEWDERGWIYQLKYFPFSRREVIVPMSFHVGNNIPAVKL